MIVIELATVNTASMNALKSEKREVASGTMMPMSEPVSMSAASVMMSNCFMWSGRESNPMR